MNLNRMLCIAIVSFVWVTAQIPQNARIVVLPPLGPDGKITELSDFFADLAGGNLTAKSGQLIKTPDLIAEMLKMGWNPNLAPDRSGMLRLSQKLNVDYFALGSYRDVGDDYLYEYQVVKVAKDRLFLEDRLVVRKDELSENMAFRPSEYLQRSQSDVSEGWGAPTTPSDSSSTELEVNCYVGSIVLCRIALERASGLSLSYLPKDSGMLCETNTGQVLKLQNQRVSPPRPSATKKGIYVVEAELFFTATQANLSMGNRMTQCRLPIRQGGEKGEVILDNQRFRRD